MVKYFFKTLYTPIERLRKKHKQRGQGTARFPDEHLCEVLGLKRLSVRTRDLPLAKA